MRVYYYTAEQYALSNIINERIKIALLDDLNDPFELMSPSLDDKDFRIAFEAGVKALTMISGIISFSTDWKNPLLWAHYGDKHKGICLGFDVDDAHIEKIDYYPKRIKLKIDMDKKFGGLNEEIINEIVLRAKYEGWRYEKEVRVYVPKEEQDASGLYFANFEGNMELKEIILGPRSFLKTDQIARYLCSYRNRVEVFQSRISFTEYEVVKNNDIQPYVHLA